MSQRAKRIGRATRIALGSAMFSTCWWAVCLKVITEYDTISDRTLIVLSLGSHFTSVTLAVLFMIHKGAKNVF